MILTEEEVNKCFEEDDQYKVLMNLYRKAIPDWDKVAHVNGYPTAGPALSALVWKKFIAFDKEHHPNVVNGGLWLNSGWSTDSKLKDWEVSLATCTIDYK